eukprot:Mrub_02343.p1 GENE.Mrub_02343~~Mrub_02343.p1  ORF type:complete len:578 (+),score=148.03 Mrub_02343:53-1735(+)
MNNKLHREENIVNKDWYEQNKDELACIVCFDVLSNPIKCQQCEYSMCSSCREQIQRDKCPQCNVEPLRTTGTISLVRTLDKLRFRCDYCHAIHSYTQLKDCKSVKCASCDQFYYKHDFTHSRKCHLKCFKCQSAHSTLDKLRFRCDYCHAIHSYTQLKDCKSVKCASCDQFYYKHDFTHSRKCNLKCFKCQSAHSTLDDLITHNKQCLYDKELKYCKVCNDRYPIEAPHTLIDCLSKKVDKMFDLIINIIESNASLNIDNIKLGNIKGKRWDYYKQYYNQDYDENNSVNLIQSKNNYQVDILGGPMYLTLKDTISNQKIHTHIVNNKYLNDPSIIKDDYLISRGTSESGVHVVDFLNPTICMEYEYGKEIENIFDSHDQSKIYICFSDKKNALYEYDLTKIDTVCNYYNFDGIIVRLMFNEKNSKYVVKYGTNLALTSLTMNVLCQIEIDTTYQLVTQSDFIYVGMKDCVRVLKIENGVFYSWVTLKDSGEVGALYCDESIVAAGFDERLVVWNKTEHQDFERKTIFETKDFISAISRDEERMLKVGFEGNYIIQYAFDN